MGILGGKRMNALYLIGSQNDVLVTLDPHYTQVTVEDLLKQGVARYVYIINQIVIKQIKAGTLAYEILTQLLHSVLIYANIYRFLNMIGSR